MYCWAEVFLRGRDGRRDRGRTEIQHQLAITDDKLIQEKQLLKEINYGDTEVQRL
jgi:hypothetical protein